MFDMSAMKDEVLRRYGFEDKGWTTDGLGTFVCPHGHRIEDDGRCTEGCVSPMLQMGVI
jgi:hypothetical protein